jgi:hypothetical protein
MKRIIPLFLVMMMTSSLLVAQNNLTSVPEVKTCVYSDVSIPLRNMVPDKKPFWANWFHRSEGRTVPNKFKKIPENYSNVSDDALQMNYPDNSSSTTVNPLQNFNGLNNGNNTGGRVTPPDPCGDVGPNHYVQAVNCMLQIFSKTGASVYGPVETSTIWDGFNGNWNGHNDGDAVVLYDENADRWLISQFAIDCSGSPYTEYELVAISTTPDPTGSYYRYAFQFDYMPDYPKLGVWNDGYYLAVNRFNTNIFSTPFIGTGAAVLERSKMLSGDPSARMIYFKTETLGGSGAASGPDCYSMLPSDGDGTAAPAGAPNYFTYINDNTAGGASELRIWALHADWVTTANSSFTFVTNLPVTTYTMLGTFTGVIPQQGTTNKLDGLGDRLMFRNQYRNFGSYETFVTCHNVNTGGNIAGVRWYEYRKTGSVWSVFQQGTYAPGDGKSRWLGSIAMNASGDIGLSYTVSSGSMYPSIYFTGRRSSDPIGTMAVAEGIIQTGAASITGATRWGDYSAINVDPTDNLTFWTTNEYIGTYGGTWPWSTKIASFKFANNPSVVTTAATAVTGTGATLNGTINPNGLATTYYFEYGTSITYGTTTPTAPAGNGTTNTNVNAPVIGLIAGTTYHYRLVGVNTDGTTYGADMTFAPGAASLTTTAASAITMTTAGSGGNVTSDGGSPVTARGVCWATSANPTTTGSHTTDGSGLGVFSSSLTGLTANTLYHVRAYATNGNGTFYGNDLTFTTLCGVYTLPFIEGFSATTIPSCWSQVDHQGNGQIWAFGVITGQSPNPALTGNYAFLNSDAYGSGSSQNADLVSPTLNLSSYTSVNLQFSHYFKSYAGSSGSVSYSIDNGTTWTQIQQFTTTSTTNPANFNQAVAATAGQAQVRFRWNYTGSYGYYWAIDNVNITGSTSSPTLTVTPLNQNVTAPAGSTTFTVNSNSAWAAVCNQTWCTVTPSGNGNGTITANYTQNPLTTQRIANVTVTVPGLAPIVVTVTQSGDVLSLAVTPPNQPVAATAGTTNFSVSTNAATPWTASSDQTWCTVTPTGTGNGTISANYALNTTLSSRVANITVTTAGVTPVVVTVSQAGAAPTLSVSPYNQTVGAVSGNTTFTVSSNSSWLVTSDQTWCTVTPSGTGNGTINATYTENTSVITRVANITVTVAGTLPVVVMVTQMGAAPTLFVSPPNQDVTAPAGNTSFNITTNSSWSASSDQGWCAVTTAGFGNSTLIATYQENVSVTQRVAHISVMVPGTVNMVVAVTQAGVAPTLLVTPANRNVGVASGTTNFTVASNTDWSATSNASWCTVTSSGNGNGIIDAVYEQNMELNPRTAVITVIVNGLTPVNVTVSQEGTVGMPERIQNNILLYPNPNSGKFIISSADHEVMQMKVEVISLEGKIIEVTDCTGQNRYSFDISGQAKGSYFVRIITEEGTTLRKIVLE